jgi:hypothetical protein
MAKKCHTSKHQKMQVKRTYHWKTLTLPQHVDKGIALIKVNRPKDGKKNDDLVLTISGL